MRHQLAIFLIFAKANIASRLEYRLGSLIWIINGAVSRMVAMAIWLIVLSDGSLPLDRVQITTYFFLSILVGRLTQVWVLEFVGQWIKDGGISSVLVKPYNYMLENLAEQIGEKTIRLLTLLPVMGVLYFILRNDLSLVFSAGKVGLFSLSIMLGFTQIFLMEQVLALFAFWTQEIRGIERVYTLISGILSGGVIPLAFMPSSLKTVMFYYPARFSLSFPLEILVENKSISEIGLSFGVLGGWILLWVIAYKLFFFMSIKKYSAVG